MTRPRKVSLLQTRRSPAHVAISSARRSRSVRNARTREHPRATTEGFLRQAGMCPCPRSRQSTSLRRVQESKQWKDRKEPLDDLLTVLTQNPKPTADSDYAELIKALRKVKIHPRYRSSSSNSSCDRSSPKTVTSLWYSLLQNV